ncbi:ABC transporter permease [Pelistega sp. MC2]|uniref:ABC transporter permease n=1 Tax=Pelistega sp. MC2 TaxID=1720297 RepID=UPI0008D92334|nr:ABC transporter permease [Pelistega sp. MC2]
MPILSYLSKRALQAFFVIIVVSLLVAFAIRQTGDPATMMLSQSSNVTQEDIKNIQDALGLNQSFWVQYWHFMKGLLVGDMGNSFFRGPIAPLIADALKSSALLAFLSLGISLVISIPLGIYAACHKGSWADQLIRVFSLAGLSFPNFWLGIMFMLLFAVTLRWLPASGFDTWSGLVLPAITMGLILTASNVRLVRTAMLEALSKQHIMVARAKGLSEHSVVYKHALRNSAITIVTYLGLQFGALMGGMVVIEMVFNWPGMGTLAIEAISQRDYPILQTTITVLAIMIVLINLLVDCAYVILDPRIRLG